MRRFFLGIILLFLGGCLAQAQNKGTASFSTSISFRIGDARVDPSYLDNYNSIFSFLGQLERSLADTTVTVQHIIIESGTSPDGSVKVNDELSLRRARALRDFFLDHTALKPIQIKAYSSGIDWDSMESLILGMECPWKDRVLEIVRMRPTAVQNNGGDYRRKLLQDLDGGKAWAWLQANVFSQMRDVCGRVTCVLEVPAEEPEAQSTTIVNNNEFHVHASQGQTPRQKDTVVMMHRDTVIYISKGNYLAALKDYQNRSYYGGRDRDFKRPVVGLRTNTFLPLLNLGVELPLGNRWSLAADMYYPWVPRTVMNSMSSAQANCVQLFGGYFEGRIWLGSEHRNGYYRNEKYRLRGHSIGLIAGACYYDFERSFEGRQGEAFAAGVGYMYSLPLGKGGCHLQFEVALGAIYNIYHPYHVYEVGGYLIRDKETSQEYLHSGIPVYDRSAWYIGYPIKAGFNVVVPITSARPARSREAAGN